MKKTIDTNHMVIPAPDPEIASLNTLKGGYTVHPPAAGPVSKNRDINMMTLDKKKNQ